MDNGFFVVIRQVEGHILDKEKKGGNLLITSTISMVKSQRLHNR